MEQTAGQIRERSEIEPQYCWDLESMFATDAAWETEYAALRDILKEDPFATARGHLGDGPGVVRMYFETARSVGERCELLYVYAHTKHDQDTRADRYQGYQAQALSLFSIYGERTSFFEPELLALPQERLDEYKQSPELADFRHALDNIARFKPHILSAETEAVLASLSDILGGARNIYSQLANADFVHGSFTVDGQEYIVSEGMYGVLLENRDRRVRERAYNQLIGTYLGHKNAISALYGNSVKRDVTVSQARRFATAREAALFGNHIPPAVYDALIDGVRANIGHLHRYYTLRRRKLNLDKLCLWDRMVPIVEVESPSYTYHEAMKLVRAGLGALGDEYGAILDKALSERWIDVFETPGKRSGAYSTGFYRTKPFILANFQGRYDDVSTLAHELGHSVHSHLTWTTQPPQYADYSIFLAEIASTANEILLVNHLLDKTDDRDLRAMLLNEQVDRMVATIYRQTMFAEFELAAHGMAERGEAVTFESLTKAFADLSTYYYGPEFDLNEKAFGEWTRIPHFYGMYYVYQYATGMCAALVFADRVRKEGKPAVDAYLGFLRSGSSAYPLDVLKQAGVDMTDPAVIAEGLKTFGSAVDALAQLL